MTTGKKLGKSPRVEVVVSQENIDFSITGHSSHCMIAEAVRTCFPGAKKIAVDLQTIRFSNWSKGERYTYMTPRVAQIAILNFDRGLKPEPFKFRMRAGQTTAAGKAQDGKAAKQKAGLQMPVGAAGKKHARPSIPERVGGRPPPTMLGVRRQFGLRNMEM